MAVCVGCGLLDPDDGVNPVRVATSGEWGDANLDFPDPDTNGAPVYCDAAGQLRTVPEHTSSVGEVAFGGGGGGVGDGGTLSTTPLSVVFNNPSAVRHAALMVHWESSVGVAFANAAAAWTNLFRAEVNGTELFLLDNGQAPGNAVAGSLTFVQGATSIHDVPPATSITLELTLGVTMASGSSGSLAAAGAIRVIAVTR